jgi:hypothetical protein
MTKDKLWNLHGTLQQSTSKNQVNTKNRSGVYYELVSGMYKVHVRTVQQSTK